MNLYKIVSNPAWWLFFYFNRDYAFEKSDVQDKSYNQLLIARSTNTSNSKANLTELDKNLSKPITLKEKSKIRHSNSIIKNSYKPDLYLSFKSNVIETVGRETIEEGT